MKDDNNPLKPVYRKPRTGRPSYRDRTAEEAVGRVDKDRKKTWEEVFGRD